MIENEVILLRNVYDHIGEMVTPTLISLNGTEPNCMVMFHDGNHMKLFFILLGDFLSKTDKRGPIKQTSFLGGLLDICENPQFSVAESVLDLKNSINLFSDWLTQERVIDIWMPSISKQINLSISRLNAIKMCGAISRHNYLRTIGVAEELRKVVEKSGESINLEQALLALPDFYERFHDDILIYLSSHICEFLNNIRWAVHRYLGPEFKRSYRKDDSDDFRYHYDVPVAIKSDYAKDCYWELMNAMRRDPYLRKFTVSDSFKSEY